MVRALTVTIRLHLVTIILLTVTIDIHLVTVRALTVTISLHLVTITYLTISLHIVMVDNFTRDYKCTFNHVHYLTMTIG